jgi:hypothetical protein
MTKEKGGWLKGLLIKEDEQPVQPAVNSGQFQARYNQPINPGIMPQSPIMVADAETPDQAYLDHLYKFMEEQNIPGPDYFEYANTLHEMGQMAGGIPEANLYQLAYVGLKAQGVTQSQLVQTAIKYIALFEKHKKEFENYLSQEGSKEVTAKTNEIQALESNNQAAEAKINELTQQIQNLQQQMVLNAQKISENNNFIQNESQKLASKKVKFEKAYQIVVDKVNGDIQKIQNYVK